MKAKKRIGVMGIIKKKDKYLIGLETKDSPFKGKWRLLGGKVEADETIEEALVRELKEEAGIKIKILKQLESVKGNHQCSRIYIFLADWTSGQINPKQDEHAQIQFLTLDKLLKLNLDGLSKEIIERYSKKI